MHKILIAIMTIILTVSHNSMGAAMGEAVPGDVRLGLIIVDDISKSYLWELPERQELQDMLWAISPYGVEVAFATVEDKSFRILIRETLTLDTIEWENLSISHKIGACNFNDSVKASLAAKIDMVVDAVITSINSRIRSQWSDVRGAVGICRIFLNEPLFARAERIAVFLSDMKPDPPQLIGRLPDGRLLCVGATEEQAAKLLGERAELFGSFKGVVNYLAKLMQVRQGTRDSFSNAKG